ncbi:MAG: hypothetical protein AAF468_02430 [Pseudomonadota bacterium]
MGVRERIRTGPKSSDFVQGDKIAEIERLTRDVFDATPNRVAFPGGAHRSAFIVDIADGLYVIAQRENANDAQLEGIVLKTLSPTGHVPEFVAHRGAWLIQQCVPGQRLPILIDEAVTSEQRLTLATQALDALATICEAAHSASLQHRTPRLGVRPGWLQDRIMLPGSVSRRLDIAPPEIDPREIHKVMDVKHRHFIKWDSRPGNALFQDGRMVWFDWEDAGRRHAIDDLVCFFADEWLQLDIDDEDRLIDHMLERFAPNQKPDSAMHYFHVAGLVQIGFRLQLAVKYWSRESEWWDRQMCLSGDKVGVTPEEVTRLVRRGLRWSDRQQMLKGYQPWLRNIAAKLDLAIS